MDPDFTLNMTCEQIRAAFDNGYYIDELDTVFDQAQGRVNSGQAEQATILITVTKEQTEDMKNG